MLYIRALHYTQSIGMYLPSPQARALWHDHCLASVHTSVHLRFEWTAKQSTYSASVNLQVSNSILLISHFLTHTHTHTHAQYTHAHKHTHNTYIHTYAKWYSKMQHWLLSSITHTHTYKRTYTRTRAHMNTLIPTCTYTYTYMHIHLYIHAHTLIPKCTYNAG